VIVKNGSNKILLKSKITYIFEFCPDVLPGEEKNFEVRYMCYVASLFHIIYQKISNFTLKIFDYELSYRK